jgi:hypothetical protein
MLEIALFPGCGLSFLTLLKNGLEYALSDEARLVTPNRRVTG